MDTTCVGCGKPIKVKPKEIKQSGNYCSKKCWYTYGATQPKGKEGIYKSCEICGKEFYVPRALAHQRMCSRACKGIASRLPVKNCAVCSAVFKPPTCNPNQPCCSRECGHIYRRSGEYRNCRVCGKEIWIVKARLVQGKDDFFCSTEHAKEYQGRNKTSHTCKVCGNTFKWSPSRTQSGNYKVTYCSLACRDADPQRREMLIAMNAKQQRLTPNKVERIGYGILDELGIEYQPQHLIGNKFCVDAFIPSLNIVLQFDGDYWHFNPAKFDKPDSRQQKRIKLDASQDAYMRTCGYTVIRIWASDLEKRTQHVKAQLQSLLVPAQHTPVVEA